MKIFSKHHNIGIIPQILWKKVLTHFPKLHLFAWSLGNRMRVVAPINRLTHDWPCKDQLTLYCVCMGFEIRNWGHQVLVPTKAKVDIRQASEFLHRIKFQLLNIGSLHMIRNQIATAWLGWTLIGLVCSRTETAPTGLLIK